MRKITLITCAFLTGNLFAQLPVSTAPQNKKAVIEEFTGIHCGYCPDGHKIGTNLHNADPNNVILINIHSGSFANAGTGEPDFKTPEGTAIDGMPTMSITGYPAGDVNREVLVGSAMATGRGSWASMVNTIKAQPAYCNVACQGTIDPQTRVLTVQVEVYYTGNSPVATNSLNVFLLENKIAGPQSDYGNYNPTNWNSDGTYNHNHVLRKSITPTFGMTIPNTTSTTLFTTTLTYTVPASYGAAGKTTIPKFENFEVVAFVTQTDKKVINANDGPVWMTNDAKAITASVPVVCTTNFAPVITVQNTGVSAITALTITPSVDNVAAAPTAWTGNLAAGATTTIALTGVPAGAASGSHAFTYTITGSMPADFYTQNNSYKTNFFSASNYNANPVAEGFVLGAFPPAGWASINPNAGPTWSRNTQAGGYMMGTLQSTKYDFFNNSVIGDKDELFLPAMNLSGNADPELTFDWAYAQRTTASDDKLEVMVSDDCGATWSTVWVKSGTMLMTAVERNSAYTPGGFDEWQTAIINLTGFNKSSVLVKFVTTSDNGNNLFLDNVNLSQQSPLSIAVAKQASYNVSVFPNPANNLANVSISAPNPVDVNVSVVNMLGQVVFVKDAALTSGSNNIAVDVKELPSGIYTIVVSSNEGSINKVLTVTK